MDNGHDSDCATHNAPAYPAGPCDCMPTQAMCRAAVVYLNGADVYEKLPREVLEIEESIYAEVWKAMRAAEPANAETERRAAELHEGCQMPMELARELAASEASPDWYARGQDWALADALSGSLPNDWTSGDIARAYAAGARAADQSARTAELVAVLARLCELNAAELPMAKVWNAAKALVDSYAGGALGPNVAIKPRRQASA